MEIEKIKNTKRNIFYGIVNKLITLFLPFLVRTILIRKLGMEYLGLNSLFTSILQVLNLSDLGFSNAIVYTMYKPVAEDDTEKICALLNYYRKIYRIIGLVILGIGLILIPFLPLLINGTPPEGANIYIIYIIYLINSSISYLLFAYKSAIPTAFHRNDILSNIQTITYGMMSMSQIIILLTINNYYIYLIMMPISTMANNLLLSWIVDRKYSKYKCSGLIDYETKASIKKKVCGLMIHKICYTSRNSFDSICVSAYLGLTFTAMYNNYFYVLSTILGLTTVLTTSMQSAIGNNVVTSSAHKNYEDMKKFNFIYMWLSGWCTVFLLCLYQPFMEIWAGKEFMFSYGVVIAFCLYFYVLKMGDIRSMYSDAAGLWWENRYRAIAESIVNIFLNIVLVQLWGIYGIIIATLISLFVINFCLGSQIIFKHYFKNSSIKKYFLEQFKYFFVSLIVCFISFIVCNMVTGNNFYILIVRMIICCVLPNIIYILIHYNTNQYYISISWLLRSLKLEKQLKFLLPKKC